MKRECLYKMSENLDVISQLLTHTNIQNYLISLIAGITLDGLKLIISGAIKKRNSDQSIEIHIWQVLSKTMSQFYTEMDFEYDEEVVMEILWKQFQIIDKRNNHRLREIIETTVNRMLTDNEYGKWVDFFTVNCSSDEVVFRWIVAKNTMEKEIFVNRNLILQRIDSKYIAYCGNDEENKCLCYLRFKEVFSKLNDIFCSCWKNQFFTILSQINDTQRYKTIIDDKISFINSNEDCCDILIQMKEILYLFDDEDITEKTQRQINSFFKSPHFNKVMVVAGTNGSGKSHFITEFIKYIYDLFRNEETVVFPVIIDCSKIEDCLQFEQIIIRQFSEFIGESLSSLDEMSVLLHNLSLKACFIIDNLHSFVFSAAEWEQIVSVIKRFSKYEQFRWIITTSQYEYYILEETPVFLQKYCIIQNSIVNISEYQQSELFRYALNIDGMNKNWFVVESILKERYNIRINGTEIEKGITTPFEAICFGDCAYGEEIVSFPETYYEYIEKIVTWKSNELAKVCPKEIKVILLQIIDQVISKYSCIIDAEDFDEELLKPLRRVQLLSQQIKQNNSIFSVSQSFAQKVYQLRVLPYWAAKTVGERFRNVKIDAESFLFIPIELKEWVIPCYIFLNYEINSNESNNELFAVLKESNLLEYALFFAGRSSADFSRLLFNYLINNADIISNGKICYALLYFVFYCRLKISQRFKLLCCISKQIQEYQLTDIYKTVIDSIVRTCSSRKNLKKNMLELAECSVSEINYINGCILAQRFMDLPDEKDTSIDLVVHDIVNYFIRTPSLMRIVKCVNSKNQSFLDYFIRRCFEIYISYSEKQLEYIYQEFNSIMQLPYPQGTFVKRNLTCAAGNVFSSKRKKERGYNKQYIELVKMFANEEKLYDRETAYHLIKNSVSEVNPYLDEELYLILQDLLLDKEIKNIFTKEGIQFKTRVKD